MKRKFVTFKRTDGTRGFIIGDSNALHAELATSLLSDGAIPTGGGFVELNGGREIFFGTSGTLGPFDPEALPKS